MTARIGIGLGSNLGDRLSLLRFARRRLAERLAQGRIIQSASVYETEPVGCPPGSPSFYNTAIEVETSLPPEDVLPIALEIEIEAGRRRPAPPNAPRPLDIDLLYSDSGPVESPSLTLPHPRLHLRRFVLLPLLELCPDRPLHRGWTAAECLAKLPPGEEPEPQKLSSHW